MVVLFLPLFGYHSCVMFCWRGRKKGGGTNWLARHTNYGAKRQRRCDGTKRSSEGTRQSIVLKEFSDGVSWNVPGSSAPGADTSLTSLQTHSPALKESALPPTTLLPPPPNPVWSSLWSLLNCLLHKRQLNNSNLLDRESEREKNARAPVFVFTFFQIT